MTALAANLYPREAPALARKASHSRLGEVSEVSHSISPLPVQATWTEGAEMYLAPKEKFCARDEHLKRISDALRRRLYPNTPLHQKVLANAIGVTRNSVNNWFHGKCDPGSHDMELLSAFFKSIEGGPLFLTEIYGDLGIARSKRSAAE